MDSALYFSENFIYYVASFISIIAEIIGLLLIACTLIRGVINYFKKDKLILTSMSKDATINSGLSTALEVLLAAEICKTITVATITNLIVIVSLIVIRLFMAYVLHIEGMHKAEMKMKNANKKVIEIKDSKVIEIKKDKE